MHNVQQSHNVLILQAKRNTRPPSPAVSCGAAQTDNTAAVVGGVTAIVVTIAVATIVVVVLLRLHCGLPARTPVQYVHIVQIQVSAITIISLFSSVQGAHQSTGCTNQYQRGL